jgi:hypothetical protein
MLIKFLTKDIYTEAIAKFKNYPSLYISFAIFQTRIFDNLIFAYSLFRKALNYNPNIIESFYIFVGRQML